MFCSKCGTENIDNAMFCKNCGASLYVQQEAQAEKEFFEKTQMPKEEIKTENTENSVIALIKKWSSSQLFLTATILLTVGLGLSLIGLGNTLSISGILALIAVWKIRMMGKNSTTDKSAFSLLRVASILTIVVSAIVFGFGGLVFIAIGMFVPQFASMFASEWNELIEVLEEAVMQVGGFFYEGFNVTDFLTVDYISIFLTIFGVAFVISCIITIIFNSLALKNINAVKQMVEKGEINKNVSEGFVIFLYVIGGINAAGILSGDIATGVMGIAYILYAVVLSRFKNEADILIYNQNSVEPEETSNKE